MGSKSTTKFLVLNNGVPVSTAALITSAGAADANALAALNAQGLLDITLTGGKTATTGVSDANRPIYTGADGKLNPTFLPNGVGPDITSAPASEAITAPALVQLWNDAGTIKVRKADASSNKPADGFIKTTVALNATADVYQSGQCTGLAGLTVGPQWLSAATPGGSVAAAPTADSTLVQRVGVAINATVLVFERGDVFMN